MTIADALGLESGRVRVVPYNPAWAELFAAEVARLRPTLESHGVTLVIEHTGSTALPGLAAKPIIDILAGRASDEVRAPAIAALVAAGYMYRGEQDIPGRDFFRRGDPRSFHVHLTRIGSTFWNDHRAFRDYLRAHPDTLAEYATLKLALAARYPNDRSAYIDGKTRFVQDVLARHQGNSSVP